MRRPNLRVRTLMGIVVAAALILWGAMMGARSYDQARRARQFGEQERAWRSIAARGRADAKFAGECADYFEALARKYRRAAWRPWSPVAPDPHAPGYDRMIEQEGRTKGEAPQAAAPGATSTQAP